MSRARVIGARVGACVLIAASFGSSCATRSYEIAFTAAETDTSQDVWSRWMWQRDVLVRVMKNQEFTLREFRNAVRFFEETTCLVSHQSRTNRGRLPNERLEEDVRRWDAWLALNGHRLTVSAGEVNGGGECP